MKTTVSYAFLAVLLVCLIGLFAERVTDGIEGALIAVSQALK